MEVVDGDTLEIDFESGRRTIELAEIDCPELDQPFGKEARKATMDLALYEEVRVRATETDRSTGRIYARVYLAGGAELAKELLARGLAWWRSDTSKDMELALREKDARLAEIGLWSDRSPMTPWDWRARQERQARPTAAPKPTQPRNCRPRSECCKVCTKGQACGASCISASYTCRRGRGCACNSYEICR